METTNDISACERLVMKVIWDSPEELALQDIMNRVNAENNKAWKPQTVSTFLTRLVKKGFLTLYRKSRYCFYQPLVSKQESWEATMKENASFFTGGDMGDLACALCKDMLNKDEMRKVKQRLEESI